MNREQLKARIQELEVYAQRNPRGYRRRVGMMALLGYGYIWFVLMVLVALIAALVAFTIHAHQVNFGLIKIGFLLLLVAWAIARSLWVKFPRLEGMTRLQLACTPSLNDELRLSSDKHIYEMICPIKPSFNASDSRFRNKKRTRPKSCALFFVAAENYILLPLILLPDILLIMALWPLLKHIIIILW